MVVFRNSFLDNVSRFQGSNQQQPQIYTEWANHYLERGRFKRFIHDLQTDVSDGVLLADVIEAVTGCKVPDIARKPAGNAHMVDNITSSLTFLANLGVNVDGITAKDIRDANLKVILSLFFNLSRYKQAQKAAAAAATSPTHTSQQSNAQKTALVTSGGSEMLSKLPSPFKQNSAKSSSSSNSKDPSTSIPAPSAGGRKNNQQERGSSNKSQKGGLSNSNSRSSLVPNSSSASSSRSASPHGSAATSFIPQPKSTVVAREKTPVDKNQSRPSSTSSSSSISHLPTKATSAVNVRTTTAPSIQGSGKPVPYSGSVLEKFKLLPKERGGDCKKGGVVSKRTSSSSGFSSARSERSDSSTSLCSESKQGSNPDYTSSTSSLPSRRPSASGSSPVPVYGGHPPKLGARNVTKKVPGKSNAGSKAPSTKGTQSPGVKSANCGSTAHPKTSRTSGEDSHGSTEQMHRERTRKEEGGVPRTRQDSENSTPQYATIQPDNPVRQSKVSSLIPKNEKPSDEAEAKAPRSAEDGERQALVSGGGAGLLKPTAAVIGTFKVSKASKDDTSAGETIEKLRSKPERQDPVRKEKGKEGCSASFPTQQQRQGQPSTLPKTIRPTAADRLRESSPSTVSIAKVSPIISSASVKGKLSSHSGSQGDLRTTRPQKTSGGGGGVLKEAPQSLQTEALKLQNPSSSVSTSNVPTGDQAEGTVNDSQPSPPLSSKEADESDDVIVNIKPMQPLTRASPYGYMRRLAPSHGMGPRLLMPGLRLHADVGDRAGGRLGLVRLGTQDTRMYTLPARSATPTGDRSRPDPDASDVAAGYMSDGDVLRSAEWRGDDIGSGYMSEGGTLYSRKAAARIRDRESSRRPINVLQDDSVSKTKGSRPGFDDSSSVSSGISDTIAELSTDDNLTGSSVSSEANPYGSLKRRPREDIPKFPSQDRIASGRKVGVTAAEVQSRYSGHKTPSGKSAVKKMDSSMQTESSAFHHMPSASWKKYLQDCRDAPDLRGHDRGPKGDVDDSRSKDKKSVLSGSSSSSSSSGKKSNSCNLASNDFTKSKHRPLVTKVDDTRTASDGEAIYWTIRSSSPKPDKHGGGDSSPHASQGFRRGGGEARKADPRGMPPPNLVHITPKRSGSSSSVATNGKSPRMSSKKGAVDHSSDYERIVDHRDPSFSKESAESSRAYSAPLSSIPRPGLPQAPPTVGGTNKSSFERKGKVKVCANTQTNAQDLYLSSNPPENDYGTVGCKHAVMQYPMSSSPVSLRDRVPETRLVVSDPTVAGDHGYLSGFQSGSRERGSRGPRLSGKSSDSDNYVTLDHRALSSSLPSSSSSNYVWLHHSPACSGGGLTEAESMESLSSGGHSVHAQIQTARANSLTHARLVMHQRAVSPSPQQPRSRSNSLRSTQSEKPYPSMLQRSDDLDTGLGSHSDATGLHGNSSHNSSHPNSPRCSQVVPRYLYPLSPGTNLVSTPGGVSPHMTSRRSTSMSHYMGGLLCKVSSKEDDIHGSSLSLVSTSSSLYSAEEKQAYEIRKLKKDLDQANDKVVTLTSQLTTNAHMVAAFEQSLSNMTSRLQHLTASAEQKDSELNELRNTIEALKKQSAEAGLAKVALQSIQAIQRSTVLQQQRMSRQLSTDSMSSVNSLSSACSGASGTSGKSGDVSESKKKKKKGWLRTSFSKAFSRSKKNKSGSVSDVEDLHQLHSDSSTPNSPRLGAVHHSNGGTLGQGLKISQSSSAIYEKDADIDVDIVKDLKKQLREKDMVLTDIRLEALSSAHQLDSLRETVNRMRAEMMNLRHDNERLQRMVTSKSLTSSQSSLPLRNSVESLEKGLSASEFSCSPNVDLYLNDAATEHDGKRVTISVFLGCHGDYSKFRTNIQSLREVLIGSVSVSSKTKWDLLDNVVKRTFKEHVLRVDPVSNLGLNAESVLSYHIGDVVRSKEAELPELLPYGYLIGDNMQICITLKGTNQNSVDGLTFEALIPKSIVQRYVSLLTEHRRIILCGPSGTGKTYLAQKLAEFLVLRSGKELTAGSVATFSVDHKSGKELRQYLANVAEQCESSSASDLPTVIILDNLHHVGSLGEVFNGFLSSKYQKCPYIIGTMNQATCSTTNLQLHHNFRWVLCANHMEPVKGFLGRFLRRKLVEHEVQSGMRSTELNKVIDWTPKVWQHLNKFLETHSSSDVTIGPRLFLSCPIDVASSQVWFTDLWNYSIIPYLLEAVREGLQLYGRRAAWEDPTEWVLNTYSWSTAATEEEWPQLLRLRPEDVGYDGYPRPGLGCKQVQSSQSDVESDPLLNMLMHLQEAASYSSPHSSNDSDSTTLDNHSSLQPEDIMTAGLESTL